MKNSDPELIQRTLAGDQRAFSALVRRYQKPLHALVWRKIGDFHIAEEITQDIFLNVYKKLQTLKNPNRFAGWLYVIATRRCIAWLKKDKHIVREVLGGFQLSGTLAENVLQEIAHIKPAAPTGSKPWLPWAVAASTTICVMLLMGSGTQYLARFQQPYSLDARSETTVELVDTSLVSTSKQKLSVRNQFGNTDTPGKNERNIGPKEDTRQIAADRSKQKEAPLIKSRWIPTNGPEGTSGGRVGLSLCTHA